MLLKSYFAQWIGPNKTYITMIVIVVIITGEIIGDKIIQILIIKYILLFITSEFEKKKKKRVEIKNYLQKIVLRWIPFIYLDIYTCFLYIQVAWNPFCYVQIEHYKLDRGQNSMQLYFTQK